MVHIFGPSLPQVLKLQLDLKSEDTKNPKNYVEYAKVKQIVDQHNHDKLPCDQIYLHEICRTLFMYSDLMAISRQWDEDCRPEYIKEEHKQRQMRVEDRKYRNLTKDVMPSSKKSGSTGGDSVKDYEKSMSFGISFIFSIFASALVGYYLGIYFFTMTHEKSLVMAVFFLIGGLLLETSLYIVKITKDQQVDRLRKVFDAKQNTQPKKKVSGTEKQKVD